MPGRDDLDAGFRGVGRFPAPGVPACSEMDARLERPVYGEARWRW